MTATPANLERADREPCTCAHQLQPHQHRPNVCPASRPQQDTPTAQPSASAAPDLGNRASRNPAGTEAPDVERSEQEWAAAHRHHAEHGTWLPRGECFACLRWAMRLEEAELGLA